MQFLDYIVTHIVASINEHNLTFQVVVLPLIAGFGLVFQEAFEETNLTATQGTLVIILNHGIGMLLSFFGGPLLSRFGYRKVAVVGAMLVSSGMILTAFANSFWVFILSFSIINCMYAYYNNLIL